MIEEVISLNFLFIFKEINFSGNEIRKVGANAIADAMENKAHLECLDLDCKYTQ